MFDEKVVEQLVKDISKLYFFTAAEFAKIAAKRNNANESNNMLQLLVVTSHLVEMSQLEFCNVIASQQERMTAAGLTAAHIDAMEEHRDFVQAAAAKPALPSAPHACKGGVLFAVSRRIGKRQFESLHRLVDRIKSVFPVTLHVESDF